MTLFISRRAHSACERCLYSLVMPLSERDTSGPLPCIGDGPSFFAHVEDQRRMLRFGLWAHTVVEWYFVWPSGPKVLMVLPCKNERCFMRGVDFHIISSRTSAPGPGVQERVPR